MDNFGIYYGIENNKDDNLYTYICSCGHIENADRKYNKCPKCGNEDYKFISPNFNGGKITSGVRLRVIENGDWGFIVERVKINGKFTKKDNQLRLTGETKHKLCFDYRNNEFYIENSRGEKT